MSCTSPGCYLVPRSGGRPKRLMDDFPPGDHPLGKVVYLPCGGCIACRRERRQELTLLQCCEASLHQYNWFVTLTYDDWLTINHTGLPPYSLSRQHLSDFNISMRKHCSYCGEEYRFFACGEYGENNHRPHYHLTIFGLSPQFLGIADDLGDTFYRKKGLAYGEFLRTHSRLKDSSGNPYWQSKIIADRWPYGNHQIYRANRETMQYVAGYVTKKLTGDAGKRFRLTGRLNEFQAQSRPSIGFPWFLKYHNSLSVLDGQKLINDVVAVSGIEWKCPRIFDKWYSLIDCFDGSGVSQKLKDIRTFHFGGLPDRFDLKRKADFDRYSANRYKDNKRSHKEII